jgi:hypothetical protein
MFTITGKVGKTTHVFVSEKEFIYLEDWILQNKGQELYDGWKSRDGTEEAMTHPDSVALYEEWLEDQGITHTQTTEE